MGQQDALLVIFGKKVFFSHHCVLNNSDIIGYEDMSLSSMPINFFNGDFIMNLRIVFPKRILTMAIHACQNTIWNVVKSLDKTKYGYIRQHV